MLLCLSQQHTHHLSPQHPEDMALISRKGHLPRLRYLALFQHLEADVWVFLYLCPSPFHLHSPHPPAQERELFTFHRGRSLRFPLLLGGEPDSPTQCLYFVNGGWM